MWYPTYKTLEEANKMAEDIEKLGTSVITILEKNGYYGIIVALNGNTDRAYTEMNAYVKWGWKAVC